MARGVLEDVALAFVHLPVSQQSFAVGVHAVHVVLELGLGAHRVPQTGFAERDRRGAVRRLRQEREMAEGDRGRGRGLVGHQRTVEVELRR